MARGKKNQNKKNSNGANLGFEEKLWQAADKMRGHMDLAEYRHVALGLIFLKYISDAFEERHKHLEISTAEPSSELNVREPEERYGVIEERDEYTAENVFWVPKAARWSHLQANASSPPSVNSLTMPWWPLRRTIPHSRAFFPRTMHNPLWISNGWAN